MTTYKQYQEPAAVCLRLAQTVRDRVFLLKLTQASVNLAEQARKGDLGKH